MAYTDVSHVMDLFNNLDSGPTTAIKNDAIRQFALDAQTIINLRLKRFYKLPITDIQDLAMLDVIAKYLVGAEIHGILTTNSTPEKDGMDIATKWRKYAMGLLDNIAPMRQIDYDIDIPTRLNTKIVSRSGSSFASFNSGGDREPIFKKGDTYADCN